MASKKVGTIIVKGTSGALGKVVCPGIDTLAKLQLFWTSIQSAYVEGSAISMSITETQKITNDPIEGGNTDRKAIIRYLDGNTNTIKRISIPSWGKDAGDATQTPEGERVPLTACQSVVEALKTQGGGVLTALDGYIIQTK